MLHQYFEKCYRSRILALLICTLLISNLISCSSFFGNDLSLTATPLLDNSYTHTLERIRVDNVNQIDEINIYSYSNEFVPIIGISYNPIKNRLRTVQSNGIIRTWFPGENRSITEVKSPVSTSTGLQFIQSGDLLLGASQNELRDDGWGSMELIGGIGIWNAETGDLERCIYGPCDDSEDMSPTNIGSMIDQGYRWVLVFNIRGINITDLQGRRPNYSSIISDSGKSSLIAGATINSIGTAYAIAYRSGETEIVSFQEKLVFWGIALSRKAIISVGKEDMDVPYIYMRFFMNDRYLAQILGDRVKVWELRNTGNSRNVFDKIVLGARVITCKKRRKPNTLNGRCRTG